MHLDKQIIRGKNVRVVGPGTSSCYLPYTNDSPCSFIRTRQNCCFIEYLCRNNVNNLSEVALTVTLISEQT